MNLTITGIFIEHKAESQNIPAGKIYLSPLIDFFDGLPVTWTIGTRPDADLVNTMLDSATPLLKLDEKPIVHSDRGAHYRWSGWIERMEKAGLTCQRKVAHLTILLVRVFRKA